MTRPDRIGGSGALQLRHREQLKSKRPTSPSPILRGCDAGREVSQPTAGRWAALARPGARSQRRQVSVLSIRDLLEARRCQIDISRPNSRKPECDCLLTIVFLKGCG